MSLDAAAIPPIGVNNMGNGNGNRNTWLIPVLSMAITLVLAAAALAYGTGQQSAKLERVQQDVAEMRVEMGEMRSLLLSLAADYRAREGQQPR